MSRAITIKSCGDTMKLIKSIILSFLITNLWAQQPPCPNPKLPGIVGGIIDTADVLSCKTTRAEYKCEQLEQELESSEINKIIQCNKKSLSENTAGNMNLPDCIWNGIKLSGETLADISKIPGKLAESIAKGFSETQACNKSIEKKREILNAFNKSIPDKKYQLEERFLGKYLEDAPCSEIEKLLSARYQGYQQQVYRNRINAINAGDKVKPLENKDGNDLSKMLAETIKSMGQSYNCYTPKVKAEMLCVGVTTLLVDAAIGGGVLMAAKKMMAIVKSKRALGRIEDAINDGRPIDLSDSSKLLAGDRLKAARELLGLKRPLMDSEKRAILESHEVGVKEGRGFFTYTQDDIMKKARALKEANFSKEQIRMLMETGITGNNPADKARVAATVFSKSKLPIGEMTPARQQGIVKVLDAMMEKISKNQLVTFDELMRVANAELSKTGLDRSQIERMVNEIHLKRAQIAPLITDAVEATQVSAATTAASTTNSGVTLTASSRPAGTAATTTNAPASTVAQNATKPAAPVSPSTSAATKPTAPTAPAVPEYRPDPARLKKASAGIDEQYAKDSIHHTFLDDPPVLQTPDDIAKISAIVGKVPANSLENIIRFTKSVKPADIEAFLKNPKGPVPEGMKMLKIAFPKLSPENVRELVQYGQKRTEAEIPDYLAARKTRATNSLRKIYGSDNFRIEDSINDAAEKLKQAKFQLEGWEKKISDPKVGKYDRDNHFDNAERAKRTIEVEKAKCRKIVDLYIAAYNFPDSTKKYEEAYLAKCGGY